MIKLILVSSFVLFGCSSTSSSTYDGDAGEAGDVGFAGDSGSSGSSGSAGNSGGNAGTGSSAGTGGTDVRTCRTAAIEDWGGSVELTTRYCLSDDEAINALLNIEDRSDCVKCSDDTTGECGVSVGMTTVNDPASCTIESLGLNCKHLPFLLNGRYVCYDDISKMYGPRSAINEITCMRQLTPVPNLCTSTTF